MNALTFIIPIYKESKATLERCFKSIDLQNCKDFNLIIVLNGKNKIEDFITTYFSNKPNTSIIKINENIGYCGARQRGINATKTDYIAFLDADDEIEKYYVERFYEAIQVKKYELIFHSYTMETNGELVKRKYLKVNEELSKNRIRPYMRDTAGWSKIIKRDFLLKNKIEFVIDKNNIIEDMYFHMCLLFCFSNAFFIGDKPMYKYYYNKGSTINNLIDEGKGIDITIGNSLAFLKKYGNHKNSIFFVFKFFLISKRWPLDLYHIYRNIKMGFLKASSLTILFISCLAVYFVLTKIRGY